jgi:hypothetical protein
MEAERSRGADLGRVDRALVGQQHGGGLQLDDERMRTIRL